jgi:predicted kinase
LDLALNNNNHIFAAILHDIGKVYVRYEKENGRVAFYDHENVSMVKSIDILKHASTEFEIDFLLTLQLIARHGTLWNKIPIEEKIKNLDLCYGHQPEFLKELIDFVKADAYGREISPDFNDELVFIDNQFTHLENYIPYNKQQFREKRKLDAVFLIGLSGSGKSTFVKNNSDFSNYSIISVDNFFYNKKMGYDSVDYKKNIKKAHDQSLKDLLNAVKNKENILVDMTNLTKEHRLNKLIKIPTTQYNHKAVVFLIGEKQITQNLNNRDHKKLEYNIISNQVKNFELPNFDEFDEIQYIFENKTKIV